MEGKVKLFAMLIVVCHQWGKRKGLLGCSPPVAVKSNAIMRTPHKQTRLVITIRKRRAKNSVRNRLGRKCEF